jgi:hypothetical protein
MRKAGFKIDSHYNEIVVWKRGDIKIGLWRNKPVNLKKFVTHIVNQATYWQKKKISINYGIVEY